MEIEAVKTNFCRVKFSDEYREIYENEYKPHIRGDFPNIDTLKKFLSDKRIPYKVTS